MLLGRDWDEILSMAGGALFVLGGLWMAIQPERFQHLLDDPRWAEFLDRPRANPIRWLALWERFLSSSRKRRVIWGIWFVVLGGFILVGAWTRSSAV